MLGEIEGRKRRGRQRVRWLDGIPVTRVKMLFKKNGPFSFQEEHRHAHLRLWLQDKEGETFPASIHMEAVGVLLRGPFLLKNESTGSLRSLGNQAV